MTITPVIFKDYPYWSAANEQDIKTQLEQICNIRKDDITQISSLPNLFVGGRKVGKIPSSSADVTPDDLVGDINYTASFLYILVNNGGTATWRRVALSSW